MEQETVNRVAELYEQKSILFKSLSEVGKYRIKLCGSSNGFYGGYYPINGLSESFLAEIKLKIEEHIKQQIEEIDNELKEL